MHKSIFVCAVCTITIMLILETRLHRPTVLLFQRFTVTPSKTPLLARLRLFIRTTSNADPARPNNPRFRPPAPKFGHSQHLPACLCIPQAGAYPAGGVRSPHPLLHHDGISPALAHGSTVSPSYGSAGTETPLECDSCPLAGAPSQRILPTPISPRFSLPGAFLWHSVRPP